MEDAAAVERASIPVERTRGPVLLISGTDDAVWPSSDFSDRVMARLAAHEHPFPDAHLRYEGAGHWIDPPHIPTAATTQGRHP
jgi:pimeloyl-ACP methyl ester carboxylesterase